MDDGTWTIAVRERDVAAAREQLEEHGEGGNLLEDESGQGLTGSQRATLRFAVTALLLTAALGLVLAIRKLLTTTPSNARTTPARMPMASNPRTI